MVILAVVNQDNLVHVPLDDLESIFPAKEVYELILNYLVLNMFNRRKAFSFLLFI